MSNDNNRYHTVPPGTEAIRLSDYGAGIFAGLPSRAGFKKAIKRSEIQVDGRPGATGIVVKPGMEIAWIPGDNKPPKIYKMPLEVVFEDDYLAIVNKPGGLVVSGNQFKTLENVLPGHLKKSPERDALNTPRAVHRLDAPTSGLVIIAKTQKARIELGRQLEKKEITKKYQAVVIGNSPGSWESTEPIDSKEALTRFRKIDAVPSLVSGTLTLLEAEPVTGRTHQIRKHLHKMNLPILGDKLYSSLGVLKGKGLFLCAVSISLQHPSTGHTLNIKIDPPRKFSRFMEGEKKRFEKYG